ncbi:bifunctional methylenetetrahydrofolate dehydrogenase/methenyltetrahydrofolate cyclohydrolase FolD [candidate division GN15 bacterium]|uniref:Bifunctional protein FolD n=1 Tax=candidate division GN15 bacterium TaxID=2072418 RepID=A0A855X324_9BACT|nr:MAG: bifunctional methylenetetrahydrofolate dehydrogenase/methenyltetrahydrofolate cyclohydrolase FolD [candidate division GN15 bacterium]
MTAQIIDGKLVAGEIKAKVKERVEALKARGVTPGLAAVLVGDDPASATYVSSKAKACEQLGIYSEVIRKPATTAQSELVDIVRSLNANPKIHGILVQSPLPKQIDEMAVTLIIDPRKDVDGFHPHNVGLMLMGRGHLLPCTPHGIIKLMEYYKIDPSGKEVVVVGRSNIVGKPVAALLMQKAPMANATVTVAHSQSRNLAEIVRRADIVIAAIGRPRTITAEMIKPGAVVIDVGVNRVEESTSTKGYRLVGDVDFAGCFEKASYITPVPGGVGPMTIAMLMSNTVSAAEEFAQNRS